MADQKDQAARQGGHHNTGPQPVPPEINNSQQLAQLIDHHYKTGRPIGIVELETPPGRPQGEKTYLVMIAGTEPGKTGQSNSALADYAYYGARGGEYQKQVLRAFDEAKIPKNSHIVMTGHSLGGMVPQDLAASKEFKERGYKVDAVITFGAPQTTPEQRETVYHRFANAGDPVPAHASCAHPSLTSPQTVLNNEPGKEPTPQQVQNNRLGEFSHISPGGPATVRPLEWDVDVHTKYAQNVNLRNYDALGYRKENGEGCVLKTKPDTYHSYTAHRDWNQYGADKAREPMSFHNSLAGMVGRGIETDIKNIQGAFDKHHQEVKNELKERYHQNAWKAAPTPAQENTAQQPVKTQANWDQVRAQHRPAGQPRMENDRGTRGPENHSSAGQNHGQEPAKPQPQATTSDRSKR
jgi:hypothetical protein